ncbi:hypothetical protein TYRP_019530 [Tyrophagus putrescentiae]|nr:hypothetical protein TYRP_019530 [Tyrophagus putrescentiae]
MNEPTKPDYFTVKKLILLVVIGIDVLHTCYQLTLVDLNVRAMYEGIGRQYPELDTPENREATVVLVYVLFGLNILYHLSMVYGVVKHHVCLVTTLTVFQVLGALLLLVTFLFGGTDYLATVIAVLIALVAYLFLRDIRLMREQERAYKVNSVVA